MRLRLRGKQLSVDGGIAVGVVVKGVTPGIGIEHLLRCGRRVDLEIRFGVGPG